MVQSHARKWLYLLTLTNPKPHPCLVTVAMQIKARRNVFLLMFINILG